MQTGGDAGGDPELGNRLVSQEGPNRNTEIEAIDLNGDVFLGDSCQSPLPGTPARTIETILLDSFSTNVASPTTGLRLDGTMLPVQKLLVNHRPVPNPGW